MRVGLGLHQLLNTNAGSRAITSSRSISGYPVAKPAAHVDTRNHNWISNKENIIVNLVDM